MAKMSKLAKDIKNQPKLKKQLAEYIASNTRADLKTILLEGHRGFLAMSEKELCGIFDEKVDGLKKTLAEYEEIMKDPNLRQRRFEPELLSCKSKLKEAEALYDSLFEHLFL